MIYFPITIDFFRASAYRVLRSTVSGRAERGPTPSSGWYDILAFYEGTLSLRLVPFIRLFAAGVASIADAVTADRPR